MAEASGAHVAIVQISMSRHRQKGFTFIELMVVVAVLGIIASLAIPAFLNYMNRSRTTEASIHLDAVRKKALSDFAMNGSFPVKLIAAGVIELNIPATPAISCCQQNYNGKGRCAPDLAVWLAGDWPLAGLQIEQAHYFQYAYHGGEILKMVVNPDPGVGMKFYASAKGDTDCDGDTNLFTVEGASESGKRRTQYFTADASD